jgi:vacuolar-type H+-ATPase subunit B/Vma2
MAKEQRSFQNPVAIIHPAAKDMAEQAMQTAIQLPELEETFFRGVKRTLIFSRSGFSPR